MPHPSIRIALDYLAAMEARDLDLAQTFCAPGDLVLTFPGGRRFTAIDQIVANSSGRYARIGKVITETDGFDAGQARSVVYVRGTLYGEWADGTAFEGIRFIDRFELEGGLIRRQDVWNDTGEARLARAPQEV